MWKTLGTVPHPVYHVYRNTCGPADIHRALGCPPPPRVACALPQPAEFSRQRPKLPGQCQMLGPQLPASPQHLRGAGYRRPNGAAGVAGGPGEKSWEQSRSQDGGNPGFGPARVSGRKSPCWELEELGNSGGWAVQVIRKPASSLTARPMNPKNIYQNPSSGF